MILIGGSGARAAGPDWKGVEQALDKSGQIQPGEVFRVGMPRTDLSVTVNGVPVKAGFALGSYAAFKQMGDRAMVMGDLVLLDREVPAVMKGLLAGGLEVTAVHNHLNEISPHVMYMHYEGHGDAVALAHVLRQALGASGTPFGAAAPAAAASAPSMDTGQIEQALEGGKAATTGDFVLIDKEVNAVARALTQHGIDVTAIHNHGLADTPRLFYMHFWGVDTPAALAEGLKAALQETNSQR